MSIQQKRLPKILWSHPSRLTEQDCACPVNTNLIFDPQIHSDTDDGDCACSTCNSSPSFHYPSLEDNSVWQVSPSMFQSSLPESHWLLFNPLGPTGPVVVNQAARNILDAFINPISLQEAIRKIQDIPTSELLTTTKHLVILGLLTSPTTIRPSIQPPNTLTTWLHITNDCNLRCDYCYVSKTPDKMEVDRGKQAVDAVFRSALANGFKSVKLKYAGGESTLNFPLILILHDYAETLADNYDLGLSGVVLSNGIGISDRMIDSMEKRKLRLSISLDGIGDFHDAQRKFINGKGSFKLVERTLDRLASHNIKPSITITVSNRNLEGLPQVVEYILRRELPFTINFYRENECSVSFADLAYNDEKIIDAMLRAFSIIENNLPSFSILGSLVDRARLDTPHDKPCGVGQSYLVIDQKGKVAKCHMEIERSVTDITAADPLKLIRLDQIGIQNIPVDEKEGCRECAWRYWCAGGCPALTYRVTGRYDVKSPNCRIYKALFPEVLRLEGLRLLKYSHYYST